MFQKATKARRKLRAAMFGPSGAGKTYSALAIASGLGERVAVIDTERGSASLYSDRFSFDVADLQDRSIRGYCTAIKAAAGYDVLIIDSLSHAWQELLQDVEQLAKAKYRGNTWSAWSEGTPRQRQLVDCILDFPGHIIGTMRSKTEWATQKNERGKDTPVRVGLAPEQGKGIEYEFDVLLEMSTEHVVNVIKDRSGKFQDRLITTPGVEFGQELRDWLADGVEPAPRPAVATPEPAPTRQAPPRPANTAPAPNPEKVLADVTAAVERSALTLTGKLALIHQLTDGRGRVLADIRPDWLEMVPTVIVRPESVERLNAGCNSKTGEPLDLPAIDDDMPATWAVEPQAVAA